MGDLESKGGEEIDEHEYKVSEDRMILVRSNTEWRHTTPQSMARSWMQRTNEEKSELRDLIWSIYEGYNEKLGHHEHGFLLLRSREYMEDENLEKIGNSFHKETRWVETTEILLWKPHEYDVTKRLYLSILKEQYADDPSVIDNRSKGGRAHIHGLERVKAFFENKERIVEQNDFPLTDFNY